MHKNDLSERPRRDDQRIFSCELWIYISFYYKETRLDLNVYLQKIVNDGPTTTKNIVQI